MPLRKAVTKQQHLYLATLSVLAAAAILTYFAVTIDRFGWEVDFTQWIQGFSPGPARFLRGWVFWMGVRGVAGAVFVLMFAIFWFQRRRVEAVFLVLVSIPDLINIAPRWIYARPRPPSDIVEVLG